jgi:hypothetical protein
MINLFKLNKAQTSIEFIVIFAVVLLISFYLSSTIYNTSEINKGIYSLKQNTIDLLTLNNSSSYIESISYIGVNKDINFTIDIKKNGVFEFNENNDFNIFKLNFKNTSKFENINVFVEYN